MPITIQGNWTVSVITKNAALDERFVISGATNGNGVYPGYVGAPSINVTGTSWTVNMQADGIANDQPGVWLNSTIVKTPTQEVNGQYVFLLQSEDYIQDNTYDDLVLRFTAPIPVVPPPFVPVPVPPVFVPEPLPAPIPQVPTPPPAPKPMGMGRVYTKITNADRLPKQQIRTTSGIWLDSTGSAIGNMLTFFTSSVEPSSSFRRTIYQKQYDQCAATSHFAIAYGHDGGSGSRDLGGYDWMSPTNAVYGQYRSLCLNPDERRFKIGSKEIVHFYSINVTRARMGDRLDEGHVELNLAELSGSKFLAGGGLQNAHTGSNVKLAGSGKVLRLIDDSRLDLETLNSAAYSGFYRTISSSLAHMSTQGGEVFYVVSGALETGVYNPTQPHVYGLSYPRLGVWILDADLLDASASFLTVTGSDVAGDNSMKLLTAMSGAALQTDESGDYLGFQARKVQYSYVEQYFIRVKNQDYNFTNNPTYQTGSEGDIISDFYDNPEVYITAIGLYNDNHDLLAVGKLSKPIFKDYVNEGLFQVVLEYK